MVFKPKTADDVRELMQKKREEAAKQRRSLVSGDAEPTGQSAAEIIKKQNGHNDKENSQNGNLESEHDLSMNSAASDSTSKKKKKKKKRKNKKPRPESPSNHDVEKQDRINDIPTTGRRKRRASERAERHLALIPVEERNDDSDPDDANYIVESPDEDGNPKRAKLAESASEDEEQWTRENLQNRLFQAFAGGVFYDSDDDTEFEVSDESDGSVGLLFPFGSEDDDEGDDEAEDNDDLGEDLEFDEDAMYGSDAERIFEGEFQGHENMNSDEEIDNVISTIRNKDDDLSESDESKTDSEIVGPVDDLVELASADEEDLYAEDEDEGEDLDGFITDDIEMASEAEDEEKSESEISDVEEGTEELSEQFRDHDVLKCAIDGYQTTTDNGSLLSLSRTGAPRSRSGAFRPFKFTEKKVMEVDSVDVAEDAFCWMIAPVGLNYFYKFIYERIVLRVSRRDSNYFKGILTCDNLLQISQNFNLKYGRNLNVLKYSDPLAKVEYFNPETDKVFSSQLKTLIENGRSIELKNPQIYSDEIWYLCEILQELVNTVVGSKVYLTGKESSAFPPHCDDFNNIILQLEGKQVWRIWAPKYLNSTEKFKEIVTPTSDDLKKMKLVFDDTLNEGDTIYIPKGFYYDSYTGNQHSLHLNIEWSKNMTFTEMMKSISANVWDQIEKDEPLSKRSLPLNVLLMGGEACIDYDHPSPDNDYESVVTKLSSKVEKYYNDTIPVALDNLAKSYLQTALPPMLTDFERRQSIHGHSSLMIGDADLKFTNETKVKLIRMHTQRLLYDKERNPYLAHRINNSRNAEENIDLKTIGIEKDMIKGVVTLFDEYPKWIKIRELECGKKANMRLAKLLYSNGLLMARQSS